MTRSRTRVTFEFESAEMLHDAVDANIYVTKSEVNLKEGVAKEMRKMQHA